MAFRLTTVAFRPIHFDTILPRTPCSILGSGDSPAICALILYKACYLLSNLGVN